MSHVDKMSDPDEWVAFWFLEEEFGPSGYTDIGISGPVAKEESLLKRFLRWMRRDRGAP